jgi:hypothetical protein
MLRQGCGRFSSFAAAFLAAKSRSAAEPVAARSGAQIR